MKNILLIFLISIILICCTNKNQQYHLEMGKASEDGIEIVVSNKLINDYSFVKSARYVFLESTVPIASVDRLIIYNDTIIILDKKMQSVYLFSINGNYISEINKKGRGPGEYVNIDDFTVDNDIKEIVVLDRNSNKLLYYDFEGEFQKDIDLGWKLFNKVAYIDFNFFLQNSSSNFYNKEQCEFYTPLQKYDINSQGFIGYFPDGNTMSHIGVDNNAFFSNGDNLYYMDNWSYKIYRIDTTEISNIFTLNFQGNEKFHTNNKNISNINDLIDSNYIFDIKHICVSEKFLSLCYIKNRKLYQIVYDRNQGKTIFHSDSPIIVSVELLKKMIIHYSYPQFCHNDDFISIIQPSTIKNMYANIIVQDAPAEISTVLDKINNVDINDNPILVFYKFDQ